MLRPVFLMILLFQLRYGESQPNPDRKAKGDLNCQHKNKFSEKERSQFYPFSMSDTIKLVSFRYQKNKIPVDDSIITDSLLEVKILADREINQLTDLLYNHFYKKTPNHGTIEQCFQPRHAILFYDGTGKLKEYILLCFHCDRYKLSSEDIRWGDDCSQKMGKLRDFFISMEVKFGTDLNVDRFPGEKIREED